jgi:hypothetical protein
VVLGGRDVEHDVAEREGEQELDQQGLAELAAAEGQGRTLVVEEVHADQRGDQGTHQLCRPVRQDVNRAEATADERRQRDTWVDRLPSEVVDGGLVSVPDDGSHETGIAPDGIVVRNRRRLVRG